MKLFTNLGSFLSAALARLEMRVAETEGELSQRTARVKMLDMRVRELESQSRADKKHLQQAQAQVLTYVHA